MSSIVYSVVVPVFRGVSTLDELTKRLLSFFASRGAPCEIIFVYDCGSPEAWSEVTRLKAEYPEIIEAIQLTRNFGQHNAIICGFSHCRGAFVVTMDEDLQHEPEDIRLLIEKQRESDFDVVYGNPIMRKHSLFRNATSLLTKKLLKMGIPDLHEDYSAFRLIKWEIAIEATQMNSSYTFLDGYLTWITNRFGSVDIQHHESRAGESSYSLKKLLRHSVNIFFTFSLLPQRLITYSSISLFILSSLYTTVVVARKLIFNDLIPGFATFIIVGGFGLGLILFYLAFVAEYLYQINMKTTKRPNFLERK